MLPSRSTRLVPLAALLLAASAGAQQRATLNVCEERNLPAEARCGTVEVPENRDRPGGRQLSLYVIVIPARSAAPARQAVTFFGGGPGQAAAGFAAGMGGGFPALRETHDLLFIDQRGTGRSAPLVCNLRDPRNPQSFVDDFLPAARAAACRDSLAGFADLTRYGFPELAHDVEAVRRALGYDRLDLWGGSYGTRAAQVYLRMYPDRVRSVVLQGVVPPSYLQPKDYARDTDAALAGLFAECRADAACGAAFPDVEAELRAVAARLDSARGQGEILDAASGGSVRLSIGRGDFAEAIRKMLYDPTLASSVPYVVHRAYAGDFRPVLRASLADRRNSVSGIWQGLYLAITCSEDVPRIDRAAAARDNGRTLLGDYRVRQQAAACARWPTYTPPADYYEPVRSGVPVLLTSGELDPVTPPRWGELAAATFPNGVHVVVPHAGHGYGGMPGAQCVDSLVARFIQAASARGLDADACLRRIRRPPFVIDVPEAVDVDAAVLQRLAGTYVSAEPARVFQVEALRGALRIRAETTTLFAVPLSPTRFRLEGGGAGIELEFSADASTLTVRGRGETFVLTREP
jgi:pimeloyl-ACP methyl ester carboxylesterase